MTNYRLIHFIKGGIFIAIHLLCFCVIWVGFSWIAAATCLFLYFLRMFAITGGYHRYFSHRTYETSRLFQFVLGILGSSSAQKGPLWWASHHRHHHKHSDTTEDIHPPSKGIFWAHIGWVLSADYETTNDNLIKDLKKFPELVALDKYHFIPPLALAILTYFWGVFLNYYFPNLGTSGAQMLVWGFFVSTTILYHGTFVINSLTHKWGSRRFETSDNSRNSLILALITLGEGWHNNHHRYPGSERQGFYWWEIDISHYTLKCLSWLGIVWNLRTPPAKIYQEALENRARKKIAA